MYFLRNLECGRNLSLSDETFRGDGNRWKGFEHLTIGGHKGDFQILGQGYKFTIID